MLIFIHSTLDSYLKSLAMYSVYNLLDSVFSSDHIFHIEYSLGQVYKINLFHSPHLSKLYSEPFRVFPLSFLL